MGPSPFMRLLPWVGGPTFQELALEWLASASKRLVCPANERRHIEHLRALWGKSEAELKPGVVMDALADLSERLGPATINKVHSTGRRIVRYAMLRGRWGQTPNPFDVVGRAKERRAIHRILTLEEARLVLPCMRPDRRTQALAMLYLGMRPGELKGLRKEDVDFKMGTIIIRRSNARESTKTGKERAVPLLEGLWPYLEDSARSSTGPYVFPARAGGIQRQDVKMSRTLHTALVAAGLVTGYTLICRRRGCGHRQEAPHREGRCPKCNMVLWPLGHPIPVRWYDLRHSSATLHRRAGADPLAIQMLLGHAPESLTDSLYTHLTMDDLRRELNKLKI